MCISLFLSDFESFVWSILWVLKLFVWINYKIITRTCGNKQCFYLYLHGNFIVPGVASWKAYINSNKCYSALIFHLLLKILFIVLIEKAKFPSFCILHTIALIFCGDFEQNIENENQLFIRHRTVKTCRKCASTSKHNKIIHVVFFNFPQLKVD